MDYVHFNPVRHGYVAAVRDWPYSTFHRLAEAGLYPPDWGTIDTANFLSGEASGYRGQRALRWSPTN